MLKLFEIQTQKAGLYRITARIHTNKNGAGARCITLYHYMTPRGTNTGPCHNYQSYHAGGYLCHTFDHILPLSEQDYLRFHDGGSATESDFI